MAAALAVTLVVGATSGAVAGKLVTSADIKDGAVRKIDLSPWLQQKLNRTGPAGPQGEPGPAGPAGAPGATGPAGPSGVDGHDGYDGADGVDGVDGTGVLSSWVSYDEPTGDTVPFSIDDPTDPTGDPLEVELEGLEPDGGELALAPGSYLVTLRTLSPTLGVWVPRLSTESGLTGPTSSMGVCLSLFVPCETTFPVVVGAAADLEIYLGDIGALCGCPAAPPQVSVSVVGLSSGSALAVPDVPGFEDVVNGVVVELSDLIGGLSGAEFKRHLRHLQAQALR